MLRRHRSALTFVGVVLLLAGLLAAGLYGVDRWAQNGVERQVAKNLHSALETPSEPQVSIDGFPFLTQVATRNIRQVHVVADDVGATGDNALGLAHVDLLLSEVMTTDWFQTMTASHIEGTGLIDYAALEHVATVPVSYAGDGRIRWKPRRRFSARGGRTDHRIASVGAWRASHHARRSHDQGCVVDLPDFSDGATANGGETHPLRGLPLRLAVTSVSPEADALRVGVAGDDVPLQG